MWYTGLPPTRDGYVHLSKDAIVELFAYPPFSLSQEVHVNNVLSMSWE